ncbi:MAG: EAL domain-containing protein [Actinobacteria bacterium]|nr:EAL domain-containing protein [Actinomycetota bacterium]
MLTTGPGSAAVHERSPVALIGCDIAGRIIDWNGAATKLLGWQRAEAIGHNVTDIFGRDVVLGAGLDRTQVRAVTSFGTTLDVEVLTDSESAAGALHGAVFAVVPVARAGSRVVSDSSPRVHSWAEAATIIQEVGGTVQCLTVGLIGVTAINRGYSRSTGDAVLREVLVRLTRLAGERGRAVRIAGTQFLVIAPEAEHVDGERLVHDLSCPIETKLGAVRIGSCVGTATGDSRSAYVLLDRADASIRRAASRGVGAVDHAPSDGPAPESRHPRLSSLLIDAVARRDIDVQFQPILDLRTGQVVELEVLARWTSHELGIVDPNSFIEAAEDAGLIHELGRLVLDGALDALDAARRAGTWRDVRVSVNLSAVQLAHPDVVARITHALATRSLTGSALVVELTETRPVSTTGAAALNMRALRQLGVRVAVDDFGTGCANISYLRDLPVDAIKIDRRYVAGVGASRADAAVLRSVMSLANDLHIDVIAEGVETLEQHLALMRLGCPLAQGFLYAAPSPADALRLDGLLPHAAQTTDVPVPEDEPARLRALLAADVLDTPAEPEYDEIAREAAALCGAPIAMVTFVDADRQWVKAKVGIELDALPRSQSLCAHTICADDVLEVDDARLDPRSTGSPLVSGDPHVVFYAGAAMQSSAGDRYGAVCVMDVVPRMLTAAQRAGLQLLAHRAGQLVELRQHANESRRALTELQIVIEQRDAAEASLRHETTHDPLTDALNRPAFIDQLTTALASPEQTGVALIMCDVDHLRLINDTLGHAIGDRVLHTVAARIAACTRDTDSTARLGGDEFAVLARTDDDAILDALIRRMVEHVAEPMNIDGLAEITPSISVGVAVRTGRAYPDSLMLDAESALRQAKQLGGGRVTRFEGHGSVGAHGAAGLGVELIAWPGTVAQP